ncbi:MAG: molybdopterin-dependent oxidoreductase [Anaerolineales bacterium]|nr:molybdopterin-dependent oxidoreductase [Anaerolineales bacterium]
MLLQFTNTALLILFLLLSATGSYVLIRPDTPWIMHVHRAAAWAFIALLPWKAIIAFRSLKRGLKATFDRGAIPVVSSLLAGAVILILSLGLAWTWRINGWWIVLGQTIISWHWVLGLAALPFLGLHAWRRWPNPRREVLASRRSLLRTLGVFVAGVVGWRLAELVASRRAPAASPRSPSTGSREFASFQGNAMPVTTNPGENPRRIDERGWNLTLQGAVQRPVQLTYSELRALPPAEVTATLDCTVGWYSRQTYQGIPLNDLLDLVRPRPNASYVRLVSDTGYSKTFTVGMANQILLATHIQDEILTHRHGFPLRAVIPPRRGWFWVKWLTRVDILTNAVEPIDPPSQERA